ncbi:DUF4153 domain-containing protein [Aeromicrobium duanguangcaii]|uniref:DUF4153 domain-containing protein n=1 Tax=Aeromicrobium duanguangcaii TaxID=2968086 RepID=UPI0020175293|nr:DUF4153 domain-containing protein [Aeromicrobium duanguangcaii]MCL3838007.1 DUF4173 domain-containing protein [Aeromicrobium duanguangcaii]
MSGPLDPIRSVKFKLGLLVAASVSVAVVVATFGAANDVPIWLTSPVTVTLALAVTQLLAAGMTSPLRQMTVAASRMARGEHRTRITDTSRDEIGDLARAFNAMAAELEQVERQRRDLIANVSHELRTPLTAMCALLENLADGVSEPDPAALRSALAQAERLSALVSDLLDLSRLDAGAAPMEPEPVEVADLLESAADEFRYDDRDVTITVTVEPVDLAVEADAARLRQLVANLVDNALRHSPAGGTVSLRATVDDDDWRLEVADEGPGVPAESRDRAFERFGTLAETEGGGGTGLGLAIARWVTDLHGGSIGFVDPEDGRPGARVLVTVPRHPSPVPTGTPKEIPVASTCSPASPPPQPPLTPLPSLTDSLFGGFWPDRGTPGRPRLLGWALGVGVLAGIALPFNDLGVGTFLVLMAAGLLMLFASPRRREPFTIACAALCTALASVAVIRDAEWIVILCLMAGGGLATVALTGARRVPAFVISAMAWPLAGLRGLPWLSRTLRTLTGTGNGIAVLRTVLWSVLGVVVFAALFMSADALFAEWFGALVPDLGSADFAVRLFVAFAIAGIALAGAYLALNPPRVETVRWDSRPVAKRFEWLVPVLVIDAVFIAFLVAQAAAIFGGRAYFERTTGLTYAEYVHQGFGQLTVATALTLLVVWAASRKAPRETVTDRAWLRGALGLLCVMTLLVVASALHRMSLYQEAYGFTQLRLLVDVFEGWLGLLVLATLAAGWRLRGVWLPRFGLLSGVALLLGIAAINPDAWIADHNLDRYESTGKVDWYFLAQLSDDAVPTLESRLGADRDCVLTTVRPEPGNWLEWNLGRSRAEALGVTTSVNAVYDDPCPGQTDD